MGVSYGACNTCMHDALTCLARSASCLTPQSQGSGMVCRQRLIEKTVAIIMSLSDENRRRNGYYCNHKDDHYSNSGLLIFRTYRFEKRLRWPKASKPDKLN